MLPPFTPKSAAGNAKNPALAVNEDTRADSVDASEVIMDLLGRMGSAVFHGQRENAKKIGSVVEQLELLYPEASEALHKRYPDLKYDSDA